MVTEQAVLSILPESGFIRDYVLHALQRTDSPLAFHLGAAITLASAMAPPTLGIEFGQMVYATTWILLIGESGDTRKSTAINMATDMLAEVAPDRIGDEPGSTQGLLESFAVAPQQVIFYPEFGDFLVRTESGVLAPLRAKYTDMYDGRRQSKRLSKTETVVESPRLSLLCGCAPTFLAQHTGHVDWQGGFMSRKVIFYPTAGRERTFIFPARRDRIAYRSLVEALTAMGQVVPGECRGLSEEARKLWEEWYVKIEARRHNASARWARGGLARAPTAALKLGMLCAFSRGALRHGEEWALEAQDLIFGIGGAILGALSTECVMEGLCASKFAVERATVLDALGDRARTLRGRDGILNRCAPRLPKRDVLSVLETLVDEGTIAMHDQGADASPIYALVTSSSSSPSS